MLRRTLAIASIVLALAACSAAPASEPSSMSMQPVQPGTVAQAAPVPVTLSGAVQKGPFVLGSSVTVTPTAAASASKLTLAANTKASAAIDPASDGQVFKTETSNDRGEFSVTLVYQGPASIEATGYYYNEAVGDLSSSPLTLRAVTEVGDSDASTYVNLITHLTYQRVQTLVAAGTSVAEAQAQAETELQTELGFGTSTKAADQLNLEGGDDVDNAYLFAVSTVFAQAAYVDAHSSSCSNCTDAKLQELVNTTAAAFAADGTLSADVKTQLVSARATIDNAKVEAALAARLAKTGSKAKVPDLDRVIPWSIPKAVTDCVAGMDQGVSESCRMTLCGANARPLDAQGTTEVQFAQTAWPMCGADCWEAVRCWAANCLQTLGNGVCTPCTNVFITIGNSPMDAESFLSAARQQRECDADLGLAK